MIISVFGPESGRNQAMAEALVQQAREHGERAVAFDGSDPATWPHNYRSVYDPTHNELPPRDQMDIIVDCHRGAREMIADPQQEIDQIYVYNEPAFTQAANTYVDVTQLGMGHAARILGKDLQEASERLIHPLDAAPVSLPERTIYVRPQEEVGTDIREPDAQTSPSESAESTPPLERIWRDANNRLAVSGITEFNMCGPILTVDITDETSLVEGASQAFTWIQDPECDRYF